MLLHSSLNFSSEVSNLVHQSIVLLLLGAEGSKDLLLDEFTSFSVNTGPEVGIVLLVDGIRDIHRCHGDVSAQDNSSN